MKPNINTVKAAIQLSVLEELKLEKSKNIAMKAFIELSIPIILAAEKVIYGEKNQIDKNALLNHLNELVSKADGILAL